jgi:hypothetical protein
LFRNRSAAIASLVFMSFLAAQAAQAQAIDVHSTLPDDPALALTDSAPQTSPASQPQPPAAAGQSAPAQPATDTKEAQRKQAEEQLKQQEQQRVMGVMAAFNTTSNRDAQPLTPSQKFHLFFRSATDPWPFLLAGVIAGIGQADDSFPEYGQGMQGYAKRYGASFSDTFIGNFWGNAVLPSLLHEDPRYFQKGTGSFTGRALWAATSTVWCKRDNGSWGPNYANIAGNLIGAAISNVYYPVSDRTAGQTIERGLTTSAEGIIGAEVIEFWPDIARHHARKRREKLAKQAAEQDAKSAAGQTPPAAPAPAGTPKP